MLGIFFCNHKLALQDHFFLAKLRTCEGVKPCLLKEICSMQCKFPAQTTPHIHPTSYTITSNPTQHNEKLHHFCC
jgi:hypothetical protein